MSSITPLLDTLVHQVMKQRTAVEPLPRQTLPVQQILPTATTTEFSQAGQQVARLIAIIQSLQQQIPSSNLPKGAAHVQGSQPLFPGAAELDAARLASRLGQAVRESGLFYENALSRWAADKLPLTNLLRHPQAQQSAAQNQSILGQQLELMQSGVLRLETEIWPQVILQMLVQPERNPLIKRWRDQQEADDQEVPAWQSEFKLELPTLGELRAQLRIQSHNLELRLQCQPEHLDKVKAEVEALAIRLRKQIGISIADIPVTALRSEVSE
ncbi:hypothetical protein IDSA_07590 [Pseudidiomarina salinarum]|uniref:Flagellar hook-length control protein-like C-terminal domain-containing protein n=1 Tax=Pseudidiomarina salinarum TaxID=435908 RepID=A0A094JEE3_9GAMM|nr:flagellar hook-length control protein FliK [Pseudidiomarina salinarum]KFZ30926.1 hypothetical protein IDSA_07590 [Pseudidiomarina salinarum]RUO71413.1 flagellar hook-length control protein FliK [Pseudidiomarina salinarum]